MRILRKLGFPIGKKAAGPDSTTGPKESHLGQPAYYEVWGGLESANRALWVALWFSVTVTMLLLILAAGLSRRAPVVIRVNDLGRAEIMAGVGRQPPVSEVEIKNFLALFERFFVGLNAYTYEENLRLAYSMMTPAFKEKADAMLKRDGVIEILKSEQLRTRVFLSELKVVRDTSALIMCRIKGYRVVKSYKLDIAAKEVVFEHEIVLKKVPRSATSPYGVLVDEFSESLFKK